MWNIVNCGAQEVKLVAYIPGVYAHDHPLAINKRQERVFIVRAAVFNDVPPSNLLLHELLLIEPAVMIPSARSL